MTTARTLVLATEAAYARCEAITTEQARNFSYGIKLLPPQKRRALSAVYAFARRIDDIGDSDAPAEQRLAGLAEVRAALHRLDEPGDDPVLIALGHATRTAGLPLSAFDELIDGCEADVRGTHYQTFEELRHYCHCVASTIGRLSLAVFGTTDLPTAQPLADSLGLALQLTNILRDIVEDRGNGRIYLPQEDLDRFGCTFDLDEHGQFTDDEADLVALIEFEAARAQQIYAEGLLLLPMLDHRSRACCGAMAGIYHRLLARMMARPWLVLVGRLSLPGWEKAIVAGRSLAGATS
ncbi:MAG TPA: presqualene diphosphate synthase HpnD [Pseudonocardiaceae bacterium]|jgi:phytoene synthase|nr:presqualene diphosphate synthase HpnD [Pseudonocardiaceae bacterium]